MLFRDSIDELGDGGVRLLGIDRGDKFDPAPKAFDQRPHVGELAADVVARPYLEPHKIRSRGRHYRGRRLILRRGVSSDVVAYARQPGARVDQAQPNDVVRLLLAAVARKSERHPLP